MIRWLILGLLIAHSPSTLAGPDSAPGPESLEVRFSPREDTLGLVLSSIRSAKTEILVAAYSFTSKPISLALLDAHKQGIKVRVVADADSNRASYTATQFLANEVVPVRLNDQYSIHHNKFIVIDRKTVETGSFNFSAAAVDKNAENVLVVRNYPSLAQRYLSEWERLWDEGVELPPKH